MNRRRYLAICGASVLGGCTQWIEEPRAPAGTASSTDGPPDSGTATTPATGTGSSSPVFPGYETVAVSAKTPGGELLGSVTAAIADTSKLQTRGLSDTDALPADYGMLFVYDEVSDHTFVMREMDFGIDIVYADDDGTITRIHHAPKPGPTEDGEDQTYPGRGQYVLEVVYHWTTDHGVETGDLLDFDL